MLLIYNAQFSFVGHRATHIDRLCYMISVLYAGVVDHNGRYRRNVTISLREMREKRVATNICSQYNLQQNNNSSLIMNVYSITLSIYIYK